MAMAMARTFKAFIVRQDLMIVIAALFEQEAEWVKIEDDRSTSGYYVVWAHVNVLPSRIRGTKWVYA